MVSTEGAMFDSDVTTALISGLEADLSASGIELKGKFSVTRYLGFFDAVRRPVVYNHIPAGALELIGAVETIGGSDMVESYHRLVLLTLIQQFEARAEDKKLPPWLRDKMVSFLTDLVQRLQKPRRGHYLIDRDSFLKDLATCRLKLWPCGVEFVDILSKIPRRLPLHSSPKQLLKAVGHIWLRCGGFRPFFETHFDTHMARDFSLEGYRLLYLRIAQMLRDAPHIRGVFSSSWWHDPALTDISPNLAFLNAIPVGGGAELYRMGTDDQIVAQATRLSKERTQNAREGTYRPTGYLMVWARADLLRWADSDALKTANTQTCLELGGRPKPFA